jgi:hypothetical protein
MNGVVIAYICEVLRSSTEEFGSLAPITEEKALIGFKEPF